MRHCPNPHGDAEHVLSIAHYDDVECGTGGGRGKSEPPHGDPVYEKDEVRLLCVDDFPSAMGKTTSRAFPIARCPLCLRSPTRGGGMPVASHATVQAAEEFSLPRMPGRTRID